MSSYYHRYICPFCRRNFTATAPSTTSCPHCNSILRIDFNNQITIIRAGIRPTPTGATTIGGTAIGAIVGGVIGGPPGVFIGGLIGLIAGSAAERQQRQE